MDKVEKIDQELLQICNLMQEGLCLESKWGYCPHHDSDDKCGLCGMEYITQKLGYHKLPKDKSLPLGKDKPPLLSNEEIARAVNLGVDKALDWSNANPNALDTTYSAMREKCIIESVAQAQLGICIKHYKGLELNL